MQLATMITMNDRAMLGPSPRREPARERGMPYQAPPPARQSAASLRPMTAGTPFPLEGHLIALRGKRPLYAFAEIIKWPKRPLCGQSGLFMVSCIMVKPVKTGTASRQKVSQVIPE